MLLKPLAPFGTPLKGDTIFGQFCWLAAEKEDLLTGSLPDWIACYEERPMAVFSSAWPTINETTGRKYAICRPELPLSLLGEPEQHASCAEKLKQRKANKGRRWLLLDQDLRPRLDWENLLDDHALYTRIMDTLPAHELQKLRLVPAQHQKPISRVEQQHNTINRLTMTTGKGEFAPYVTDNLYFMPGLELVVFAALDKEAGDAETLRQAFTLMGQWGFGRDASTGKGRFEVLNVEEIAMPKAEGAEACLTLGPCVPAVDSCREMFFNPFVRFGRHGSQMLYAGKPFKNPVVMADEGAVLVPHHFPKQPFIGRAISGISKAQPDAVCQGYAPYLPMTMPASQTGGEHD